jgi:GNAT superfamily N-acetyltransferase
MNVSIRQAVAADIPSLRSLIDASVRKLQAHDYTPAQIEGALRTVFGVDSQLIADGTYLVAETKVAETKVAETQVAETNAAETKVAETRVAGAICEEGKPVRSEMVIVGCGGWSKRKTLYGADQWTGREDSLLDPLHDAAKIRAFFVHPDWARRGVGGMILEACERAAAAANFKRFEMGATLTGVKLFRTKGYVALRSLDVPLGNGESLPVVHMEKRLQ